MSLIDAAIIKEMDTWRGLHRVLPVATEEQLWELLRMEQQGRRRKHYLIRLYGRANKLRYEREYAALLAAA